ncbi:MAG: cytochrome c biogenesis protein ResB [Chitinispirillaceae bacterium]|nr:cytochrome c biogenesis protein ResB [Chitinispirillaceae bacterium]
MQVYFLNRILRICGSPRLTVTCLLILGVLVVAGTLYQVDHGVHAAYRRFFGSWFLVLAAFLPLPGVKTVLAVLLVNLSAAAVISFSYQWKKAGLLLAHSGIIVLIVGAALSSYLGKESAVTLAQGERIASGTTAGTIRMPVDLELVSFSMDMHPGTSMAKRYESRVRMKGEGIDRETVIAMNRPLRYGPYSFYQSGFTGDHGSFSSTLSVVYNPVRFAPYAASVIIMAGLLLHFCIGFVAAMRNRRKDAHGQA